MRWLGRPPAARRPAALAALVALVLAVGGCSSHSGDGASPATSATPTTPSASPSPTPAEQALAALAAKAARTDFTGFYALDSVAPRQADATVVIYRLGSQYRVDVRTGPSVSLIVTTAPGLVACQLDRSTRTCLLVAARGAVPPRLFDPGLQRVFTTSLAAMASGTGLTVTDLGYLPATASLPSARCFRVSGPRLDAGEYCITDSGLVRRAQFPSGTLTLTKAAGPPAAKTFVAPVAPTPLPR